MAEPQHFAELLSGCWRKFTFEPFHEGIEICRLADHGIDGGTAILRYAAGASAPLHTHHGLETIVVLEGEQSDERGSYPAGSVITNPPGYRHSVWSDKGCVILISWAKPVEFV